MPVIDTERAGMPRSALRYRPSQSRQTQPDLVIARRRSDALTSTASALPDEQVLEEEIGVARSRPPVAPRRKTSLRRRTRRRFSPLFWLGVGLGALILIWIGVTQLVAWGTQQLNDWRYGYPRTFQMDAVLGHQDSAEHPTHLLVLNLHGEILLEEFPGGDPAKMRRYALTSLVGDASDLLPVTLRVLQRPGHQPDLVVEMGETITLLINDQGSFRPPTSEERQELLSLLQRH